MSPSGELARGSELGEVVAALTSGTTSVVERGRLLGRLTVGLAGGVRTAGGRAVAGGRSRVGTLTGALTDTLTALAPHVPVRDLLTLREHHGGLSGKELDEALIAGAARVTAGIGAAGGALAAAQLAAPPTLLAAPAQVAAETVAVVLVELKLVAELHVAHSRAAGGTPAQQASAYLSAWVGRKGLDPGVGVARLGTVVATAARQQLRSRLVRRFGRNLSTLAPFLAGAVAGAELNRRETRKLGEGLARDLRR